MKILKSTFIIILFTSKIFSQIEITMSDFQKMFEVGKKQFLVSSDVLMNSFMDLKNPSLINPQNWTIPEFVIKDTIEQINLNIQNYQFKSSFPLATHGRRINFDIDNYVEMQIDLLLRIANDSVYQLGSVFTAFTQDTTISTIDSAISDVWLLPLKIGYANQSASVNNIDSITFEVIRSIDTVDAFGTITLLDGTTEQVLRIKNYDVSEYYESDSLIKIDTIKNFIWLAKNGTQVNVQLGYFSSGIGESEIFTIGVAKILPTSNVKHFNEKIPDNFILEQNFPNPFNNSTIIKYQLPSDGFVTLKIYDLLGKEMETLVSENLKAGIYSFKFNAKNYSSGIYIYKLTHKNNFLYGKMNLVK